MIVYISHPLRSTPEGINKNLSSAIKYAELAKSRGLLPIVPHCFSIYLDDKKYRDFGMTLALYLLKMADTVWVCGDHVSEGMKVEIEVAKKEGKKIEYIKTQFA